MMLASFNRVCDVVLGRVLFLCCRFEIFVVVLHTIVVITFLNVSVGRVQTEEREPTRRDIISKRLEFSELWSVSVFSSKQELTETRPNPESRRENIDPALSFALCDWTNRDSDLARQKYEEAH